MVASASGILTLAVLVLAGPVAWAIVGLMRSRRLKVEAARGLEGAVASGEQGPDSSKATGHSADRDQVSSVAYLMGLLGYSIGIGNLWRFPYLVGRWGGGAFVVAYLICLFFVSMPAFLIEMVMGHSTRQSTIECFRTIHPRWTGLGYGQAVLLFFALSYYNILLAYAIIYVGGSLLDPLPWADNSADYWTHSVLNSFGGEYEGRAFGPVQPGLAVALLIVWVVVYVSIAFGKEILAKVTWVTVVGPVLMLFILLCRALTLEGAADGIRFYIGKFDVEVFWDLKMWAAACGQILFSLSPGFGTAITLSSYTKPNQNVFRTCCIVAFSNSTFSLIGGFAIFAILGNTTHRLNAAGGTATVEDQARAGTGLAFITIADGMQTFGSGTNVMSVLFFMTLFTLGLDSTFAWVETFVAYVEDFLRGTSLEFRRPTIVGGVCCTYFFLGLFYCTRVGNELLDVVDHYASSYVLLFGVAVESLLFTVDFGWRRLEVHLKLSTLGNPETPEGQEVLPSLFWRLVIPTTVPLMSSALLVYIFYADLQEPYENYPGWMQTLGWTLLAIILSVVPAGGLWHWRTQGASLLPPLEQQERRLAEALRGGTGGGVLDAPEFASLTPCPAPRPAPLPMPQPPGPVASAVAETSLADPKDAIASAVVPPGWPPWAGCAGCFHPFKIQEFVGSTLDALTPSRQVRADRSRREFAGSAA